jgi:hypothetical protein
MQRRMKQHYSWGDLLTIGIGIAMVLMGLVGIRQSPELIWAILFFGACVAVLVLMPFLGRWLPAKESRVEYDATSIRTSFGTSKVDSIRWDEVDEIALITSESGPTGDDVVWVFADATRSKVTGIAPTSTGFPALLEELQRLPGFDHEALLLAMGSVTLERFVVWRRPVQ